MTYSLIPARADQKEIIFDIKKRSIKPYVEAMFGWDEGWQRDFVYKNYKPQHTQFIEMDQQLVGLLEVEENGEEIFLKNILIVDEHQGKGIGAAILKTMIKAAIATQRPIRLEVLTINKRAKAFYERLGFSVVGVSNIKIDMRFEERGGR